MDFERDGCEINKALAQELEENPVTENTVIDDENGYKNIETNKLENIHKNLLPILEKLQSSVSRKTGERVWRLENDNFAWGGIIPNANAVIRVGTLEQKQNMLKLFCGMLDGKELKDTLSIFSECKKEQTSQTEDIR